MNVIQGHAPPTYHFPAAVEFLGSDPAARAQRCLIHHAQGYFEAWSWLHREFKDSLAMPAGWVTTLELPEGDDGHVLVGMNDQPLPVLADILNPALCPVPGVVEQTAQLIDTLTSAPLRTLLVAALLLPDAHRGYWASPASRRHHHAYPGGLARHSLEVATLMASISGLSSESRELGIAGGLLHDFGKIWCYGALGIETDGRRHESIGLAELEHPIQLLRLADENAAATLTELLGGPRVHPAEPYPLSLGKILRAMDQHSCEVDRRCAEREAMF